MANAIDDHGASAAHATRQSTANGKDKLPSQEDLATTFQKMLEDFRTSGAIKVDGGDGDDTIDAEGWKVRVDGGKGDDTINAWGYDVRVQGGAGNDIINVRRATPPDSYYHHTPTDHFCFDKHYHSLPAAQSSGGDGDDVINSEGFSRAKGGAGNDTIHIGGGSAFGGSGDDFITSNGGSAHLNGGAGNDKMVATGMININSSISGGAGDDEIYASGSHITMFGGTGDDAITLDGTDDRGVLFMDRYGHAGVNTDMRSFIDAGQGDDAITLVKDAKALICYFKDSGHDTLEGANEESTIKFGPGLTFESAAFSSRGEDMVVTFDDSEGSLTIKNYLDQGVAMMEFADGRVLDASTAITYAGGDPDAYRADDGMTPASTTPETSDPSDPDD